MIAYIIIINVQCDVKISFAHEAENMHSTGRRGWVSLTELQHIVPIILTLKNFICSICLRSGVGALTFYELSEHATKWWQVAHFWQDQKYIIPMQLKQEGIDQLLIGTELNIKLETFQVATKLKTLKKVKMRFCESMFLN